MYRVQMQTTIDATWLNMEPIVVGPRRRGGGTPDAYITIERAERPFARIDAYRGHSGPFTELAAWGRFVVLGWGSIVHLVDPARREGHALECNGYFGHLYPCNAHLLVATASEVICVNEQGSLLWKRPGLALDGVVIDSVENGIILGQGEWDPPGGWRSFRISLTTGAPDPS